MMGMYIFVGENEWVSPTSGYYGCYNSSVYTGYGASLFQPKYSDHQKSKTKPISGKQLLPY
jgi:hypothetical protein